MAIENVESIRAIKALFNEQQVELLIEALAEKEKRHRGWAETTKHSGYGPGYQKWTTEEKINKHREAAENCAALGSFLAEEWN